MDFDEIKSGSVGNWAGDNTLRLSWMNPQEYRSHSELSVTQAVGGKYLAFAYTWSHEDMPQEGLLLVGYDGKGKVVNAAWVDSWHASEKPLALSGDVDGQGKIDLRGTYEVPNHPEWGWRIVVSAFKEALEIIMYNVSPEGTEDLAVRADYKKRSSA
ncbi:MAG TPA: DUF1579 family protein [Pyrinomonadaceae bacterium]|nr:DUF1579 family protein [Pyrinomonadaceae bacterium]